MKPQLNPIPFWLYRCQKWLFHKHPRLWTVLSFPLHWKRRNPGRGLRHRRGYGWMEMYHVCEKDGCLCQSEGNFHAALERLECMRATLYSVLCYKEVSEHWSNRGEGMDERTH